ncbi:MAG: HD-GYP domain-containing protein [bacterium]
MKITKANIPYTLLVSERKVEPGDKLAADCFDRNGQKVASEGEEVTDKLKRQMKNMGVRKAWLERRIPEWMPLAEAKIRNYEILETHDVTPLHYQILTNLQGAFSTDGLDQLLDRIQETDTVGDTDYAEEIEELFSQSDRLKRREKKLHRQIDDLDDEELSERYYNLLSCARPQAVDPSEIEQGKSGLGRKIQGFLEQLNELKTNLSEIILDLDEDELIALFHLENLGDYDKSPDFADSFVLFERMFAPTDHEDDPILDELFETSREFLQEMFYDRHFDQQKLRTIDEILWERFDPNLAHWFMGLGQPGELKSYLLTHSVNTAILMTQLYRTSDRTPERESQYITLACLLKDIGMVLVPQSYHLHQEELSDEQLNKLKIHPLISVEFLDDLTNGYTKTLELIEKHHEQIDGDGYPRGSQRLDQDQRLLNVCDMFDAMTSPRMWRAPIPPNDAMKYLRQDAGDSIDAQWVNHLIQQIGIFPVGTVVRLSNEEPSIVVKNNPKRPDKPTVVPVQSLMQSNGDLEIIDLQEADLSVQAGGTDRKAPLAIRRKFTQSDQISSRNISPS